MDCAVTGAIGVFLGYIRGECEVTGRILVHRGMVYVIERDIILLSQTALKDLGVIPNTFPKIGEFGGVVQQGDGCDRFDVDAKHNLSYIAARSHQPPVERDAAVTDSCLDGGPSRQDIKVDDSGVVDDGDRKVLEHVGANVLQDAVLQPLGE